MKNEKKKIRLVNLNSLLNTSSFINNSSNSKNIKNSKDNSSSKNEISKYYSNGSKYNSKNNKYNFSQKNIDKKKYRKFFKNKSKTELQNLTNNTNYNTNISLSLSRTIDTYENINKKINNISLEKPFNKKIKNLIRKDYKNLKEINTYHFNFDNIKLLNFSKDKETNEKKRKSKTKLTEESYVKKIPIKYTFPKLEKELISVYENINCQMKGSDIIENSQLNNNKISLNAKKNILICTQYISENINDLIKERIEKLKNNEIEEKKDNNLSNNSENELVFNVLVLNNNKNIKINNYNPLNNYSIYKNEININDLKSRNNSFKKFHIYNKKFKGKNAKYKKFPLSKPIKIKRKLSFEKMIKEKSQNIFFEYYSFFDEIPNDINRKNENELKSYLNIEFLSSKLKRKINELNQTIKKSAEQMKSNDNELKSKTSKLIENVNTISSLSNNLANDIILHKCDKDFAKIKLKKSFDEIDILKDKFEKYSYSTNIEHKESIKLINNYKNRIIELKEEIENLRNKIRENKKAGIRYYLNILKEGKDNRNIGLSWIVKRLLRLNYIPSQVDFPDYIDRTMYDYFMNLARNNNIILDCLQELGEIKRKICDEKPKKNNQDNLRRNLKYSFTDYNLLKRNTTTVYNSKENNLREKLKKLLEDYSFWTIGPEVKSRIDSFCTNNITKTIGNNEFLKHYIIGLKKNNSSSNLKKNQKSQKKFKEILNTFDRVFKLKNTIQNKYIVLEKLKKEMIQYIKKLLNNKGIFNENSYIFDQNLNKDSTKIKIIRNLIGNENKLKDISRIFI